MAGQSTGTPATCRSCCGSRCAAAGPTCWCDERAETRRAKGGAPVGTVGAARQPDQLRGGHRRLRAGNRTFPSLQPGRTLLRWWHHGPPLPSAHRRARPSSYCTWWRTTGRRRLCAARRTRCSTRLRTAPVDSSLPCACGGPQRSAGPVRGRAGAPRARHLQLLPRWAWGRPCPATPSLQTLTLSLVGS